LSFSSRKSELARLTNHMAMERCELSIRGEACRWRGLRLFEVRVASTETWELPPSAQASQTAHASEMLHAYHDSPFSRDRALSRVCLDGSGCAALRWVWRGSDCERIVPHSVGARTERGPAGEGSFTFGVTQNVRRFPWPIRRNAEWGECSLCRCFQSLS